MRHFHSSITLVEQFVFHAVHISPKTFYYHFTISFAYRLYGDGKKERDFKKKINIMDI